MRKRIGEFYVGDLYVIDRDHEQLRIIKESHGNETTVGWLRMTGRIYSYPTGQTKIDPMVSRQPWFGILRIE